MIQRRQLTFATVVSLVAAIGFGGCSDSEQAAKTKRALAEKKIAEQKRAFFSDHPNAQAIVALEVMGGTFKFDMDRPQRPVVEVVLSGSQVTDAGLVHLQDLSELTGLALVSTGVTDDGLVHVSRLTKLRTLNLDSTPITDAGLEHLGNLPELYTLALIATQVTDAGLEELQDLTKLHFLGLNDTQVSDVGLVHLYEITSLRTLYLSGTHVTDAGVNLLKETLPQCQVQR